MNNPAVRPVVSSDEALKTEPVNILIVDDRPDKLLAIETVIAELGENIVRAYSGIEALRLLLRQDFAVILLDVSMPTMDGFETASLIRQRARSEHTPIIFVTSINTTETHVSRGYSLGAVDYIFSPVEPEILRAKVAVFIDLYKKNKQIQTQAEELRRQAEERAANLELRLHGVLNRLNVGVFRAREDGIITEANPAFMQLIGIKSPAELGKLLLGTLLGDTPRAVPHEPRDLRDVEFVRHDGSKVWILLSLAHSTDERGNAIIEGLAEDITERKLAEHKLLELNETLERRVVERTEALRISQEHLRRSERLASLGTFAAGIAHEINNPLNAILMTAKYALRSNSRLDPVRALTTVCDEAERGGKIVKGILKFAKEETAAKVAADLNELVRHTRDLVKASLPGGKVGIELDLESDLPFVFLNSTAIEQVLINLINNAVEAAGQGASITLRTRRNTSTVSLQVHDNGPGIPAETLQRVFDPFFSTKRSQGGTGLGLSICHGIVVDHKGTITVDSEIGRGTVFSIELPACSETVREQSNVVTG